MEAGCGFAVINASFLTGADGGPTADVTRPSVPRASVATGGLALFWHLIDAGGGLAMDTSTTIEPPAPAPAPTSRRSRRVFGLGLGFLVFLGAGAAVWSGTQDPQWPERGAIAGRRHRPNVIAFAPDSQTLAVGGGYTDVALCDVASMQIRTHFDSGRTIQIAFAPDGRSVAIAKWPASLVEFSEITIWDVEAGRKLASLEVPLSFRRFAFSLDGRTFNVDRHDSGFDEVMRWNTTTWEPEPSLRLTMGSVRTSAFSPDGKRIAVGNVSGEIRVWDLSSGLEVARFDAKPHPVHALAFSPDSRLLASSSYANENWESILQPGTLQLWDLASGQRKATWTGHASNPTFSPDGRFLAATGMSTHHAAWTILLTEADRDAAERMLGTAGKTDSHVVVRDVSTARVRSAVHGIDTGPWSVAFSPDGQTMVTSLGDGSVHFWSVPRP
jgi:WD40 repeat protein